VGNRFAVYADNPFEPIFEGVISRCAFSGQSLQFSRTLDGMGNAVRASWTRSGPVSLANAVAEDTASQSIYGILNVTLSSPYRETTDTDAGDALRDGYLARAAYPLNTILPNPGGKTTLLKIEGIGFSQTLKWDRVITTQTTAVLSDIVNQTLDDLQNNGTFFNNLDQSQVEASTVNSTNDADGDKTALDVMKELAEIGDGVSRFVMGVERSNPFTRDRRFYFGAADETVKYIAYDREGLHFRLPNGGYPVRPWLVRPDGYIRINDIFIGWSGSGNDPRLAYLSTIQYDMNTQKVTFQSDNDVSLDGVFEQSRINKPIGKPFGQPRRDVVF
jgi:hypothetical protein